MLKVLIVAAFISIVISMIFEHNKSIAWIEGAAILGAVTVVTLVTAYNDFAKES
jgi:predicted branched-subunit amino acid permease